MTAVALSDEKRAEIREDVQRRLRLDEEAERYDVREAAAEARATRRPAGGSDAGRGSEPARDVVISSVDAAGFRVDHVIPADLISRNRRREARRARRGLG